MSKKKRRRVEAQAPQTATIAIDAILAQLSSMRDNAKASIGGIDPEGDEIWQKDIAACEAATAILSALQDEGVQDPEQVRDLVHDYNALADQYQKMHQHYEEQVKPELFGLVEGHYATYICPKCKSQVNLIHNYCWKCGKRFGFRR